MNTQLIIQIAVVAIVVIIFIAWLVWQIKKKGLKGFTIDMILAAEDMYNKGQNDEKMQYVIVKIKAALKETRTGKIISVFVTEENIRKFIQSIFDSLKKALDYVPNNNEEV